MTATQHHYEPVVLDLADPDDYGVLTEALSDYAAQLEYAADTEDQMDRDNGRPIGNPQSQAFRNSAARARRMYELIHEELDGNSEVRRGR